MMKSFAAALRSAQAQYHERVGIDAVYRVKNGETIPSVKIIGPMRVDLEGDGYPVGTPDAGYVCDVPEAKVPVPGRGDEIEIAPETDAAFAGVWAVTWAGRYFPESGLHRVLVGRTKVFQT